MTDTAFDPSQTCVRLRDEGSAQQLPGGDQFWLQPRPELERIGRDWLVSEFECASHWPMWEMHPAGDEFVYLLSGAAELVLELPSQRQHIALAGRAAVVVPRGVWHTARILAPCRLLFVTRGEGTEHRPVEAAPLR